MSSEHYCQFHPESKWDWHRNFRGKTIMGCPVCSGVSAEQLKPSKSATVKYSPTFWRERPLTDKERQFPPRRG